MTALLALIFFPEERHILRQWQFQVGTLLGLVGAVGVFWFQPGATAGHVAIRGLLIAFIATTCWALYGVLVKRPSARLGSIRSFGLISLITSVLLFPLTCAFGNVGTPVEVSWFVNLILAISAVTCTTMAHVLYYVAIQEIGVALAQTLQLLCPLGAVALSAWIFGEHLTAAQTLERRHLVVRRIPRHARETSGDHREPQRIFDRCSCRRYNALTSFQHLGLAHQLKKPGAITVRICASSVLRPLQHRAHRSASFELRIAQ